MSNQETSKGRRTRKSRIFPFYNHFERFFFVPCIFFAILFRMRGSERKVRIARYLLPSFREKKLAKNLSAQIVECGSTENHDFLCNIDAFIFYIHTRTYWVRLSNSVSFAGIKIHVRTRSWGYPWESWCRWRTSFNMGKSCSEKRAHPSIFSLLYTSLR